MARPLGATGPKSAAERKAAQRQRDRLAVWSDAPLSDATNEALLSALGACLTTAYPERAGRLLAEVARRAGVNVTVTA